MENSMKIAKITYIEWLISGKQIFVCLALLVTSRYVGKPFAELSKLLNIPFQYGEPFIAAVNSIYIILIILFGFLVLFSDFPKKTDRNIEILIRVSKSSWYGGKILFAFMAATTYTIFVFIIFSMYTFRLSYLANGWSPIMKDYVREYVEIGNSVGIKCIVTESIFYNYSPIQALFSTIGLMILMF